MRISMIATFVAIVAVAFNSYGATVTASRDYVDRRTALTPVTNNGEVVGFKLGVHTNDSEVLAAKSYVDNSTPGDYETVSNAAISAAAQTNDFLRKTGGTMTGTITMSSGQKLHFSEGNGGSGPLGSITSGSSNLTARAEMENYVTNITSTIKTDRITDGTNTIDAAGNVFLVVESSNFSEWVKTLDESGASFTSLPYWKVDVAGEGWYADYSIGSEYLGNTRDATRLEYGPPPFSTVWERTTVLFVKTNYVGKLALTNDTVTVASPSTNAVAGTAADAKATGTAIYTGFTVWDSGWDDVVNEVVFTNNEWHILGNYYNDHIDITATVLEGAGESATKLSWELDGGVYVSTRHLVTPTNTSQLVNDGTNGVPFALISDISEFASTGAVARATVYGTPTRWTDATGCVWEVSDTFTPWQYEKNELNLGLPVWREEAWYVDIPNSDSEILSQDANATWLMYAPAATETIWYRNIVPNGQTNLVGRVALTNDIPAAPSDYETVSNRAMFAVTTNAQGIAGTISGMTFSKYPDAAPQNILLHASNLDEFTIDINGGNSQYRFRDQYYSSDADNDVMRRVDVSEAMSTKQDALPYLTNAIPYSVISGGPVVSPSDPTFSNAVLSVGLNIDTNTVEAINALVEQGDGLPIGGATTVGVLLLALAAAIAALKRKKADKSDIPYALVAAEQTGDWQFSGEGVQSGHTYTVDEQELEGYFEYTLKDNGSTISVADIGEIQKSVDFSLSGSPSVNITATRAWALRDRAVNTVDVTGAMQVTLPPSPDAAGATEHRLRDLLVRLTVSADAAVTFSAPSRETVTWDEAGSPTATYEAGTHLLRFTEVGLDNGSYIFHFTDLGDGGSIDPAVLNGKLEATSAAPAFDPTKTYSEGEYVTYEGVLYECSTAVTTAGPWTGSTNWTATDMTTPDATLDLMADGRLRLVSADGEVLWMQGYGLASASSVALSCDKVNFYAFASGTVTQTFDMPSAPSGKVGDFVLDVDNTANASASATATLTGAGTAFDVFTPEGVNLSTDILTFAGGEQCELYFTMTAFGTAAKPAWKVVKQIVEKQEFGS